MDVSKNRGRPKLTPTTYCDPFSGLLVSKTQKPYYYYISIPWQFKLGSLPATHYYISTSISIPSSISPFKEQYGNVS